MSCLGSGFEDELSIWMTFFWIFIYWRCLNGIYYGSSSFSASLHIHMFLLSIIIIWLLFVIFSFALWSSYFCGPGPVKVIVSIVGQSLNDLIPSILVIDLFASTSCLWRRELLVSLTPLTSRVAIRLLICSHLHSASVHVPNLYCFVTHWLHFPCFRRVQS